MPSFLDGNSAVATVAAPAGGTAAAGAGVVCGAGCGDLGTGVGGGDFGTWALGA